MADQTTVTHYLAWISDLFDHLSQAEDWPSIPLRDRAQRLEDAARTNHFERGRPKKDWDDISNLDWVDMTEQLELMTVVTGSFPQNVGRLSDERAQTAARRLRGLLDDLSPRERDTWLLAVKLSILRDDTLSYEQRGRAVEIWSEELEAPAAELVTKDH